MLSRGFVENFRHSGLSRNDGLLTLVKRPGAGRSRVEEPGAGLLVVEAQVFFFHTDETAAVADNQMVQDFNGHQLAGGY